MTSINCKCGCTLISAVTSLFIGVIAAFLQITGMITVTPAFLWVTFGIAVAYLAILLLTATIQQQCTRDSCACAALNALLAGVLGSILFSIILLAAGIVATSIVSAILVALLLLSFSLMISNTVCIVKYLLSCTH